jgi:hypothetical protein
VFELLFLFNRIAAFDERRKTTGVLSAFQQNRQQEASRFAACVRANANQISFSQRASGIEFFSGQSRAQAEVGGTINWLS